MWTLAYRAGHVDRIENQSFRFGPVTAGVYQMHHYTIILWYLISLSELCWFTLWLHIVKSFYEYNQTLKAMK